MITSLIFEQAAVIPIRAGRVCLVTSSGGKRWLVPKGRLETGTTAGEIALLEAWEEAGLVGTLDADPLGTYHYSKLGQTYRVTVFLMHVLGVAERWPEMTRRLRCWLRPHPALARISDPGLRGLMGRLLKRELLRLT